MNVFILYLTASICLLVPSLGYTLFVKVSSLRINNQQAVQKIKTWFTRIVALLAIVFIIGAFFHNNGAMITKNGETPGSLNPAYGCVNLLGTPYGDNRFLNFLAWFGAALQYPAALIALLIPFFPSRTAKVINKYIALPVAFLEFVFLFNICNALNGNLQVDYRNILLSMQVGFIFASAIIMAAEYREEILFPNHKDILKAYGLWLMIFFATLPINTLSTLFPTDGILFGTYQTSLRIYDLSFTHRLTIYFMIFLTFLVYFTLRNSELNLRKSALIAISAGCLMCFMGRYNANYLFYYADGVLKIDVNTLPIHLCHTALFVVPICIAFNFKRLFYFTYFINVFGAVCAILMPNTGEMLNIYAPNVVLYWYNHWAAFAMPLLCVALKVFERAKFKQMLWSLGFFGLYFVIIMFANAWLSNYVPGYNPDIVGSGTDYFFINNDFIASKLMSDIEAEELLSKVAKWQWGDLVFVIRPPYQAIYFGVYIAIAFAVWFIYSLFFRIADSHIELRNMLLVARKENLTMKERRKMESLTEKDLNPDEVSLVFENFSKRYGNSPVLSAKEVNLEVKGGQIFGFLGPNGAGKSTCIKSAIGIQPVTSGNIFVCGHDAATESVKAKSLIGYVPDHYALYEKLTGREYINYIADLYHVSREDRDIRIEKYVNLFELNQAFDNRMQTYSHGMKQKIAIIAALVHDPKVWILDEPLTGLDPQSIFQVKQCMIQHAKAGNIVFFSSHIIDVVEKLCTDIAIIKKGQIVYRSSMEQIEKEHPEGLEAFYLSMIHDNGDLDE
ncbi:MAG: YwaF family protein [Bacilli bacterium]|nr:YwaF family protein [Bacilli bacterium]